jgi:hypothetical protein
LAFGALFCFVGFLFVSIGLLVRGFGAFFRGGGRDCFLLFLQVQRVPLPENPVAVALDGGVFVGEEEPLLRVETIL